MAMASRSLETRDSLLAHVIDQLKMITKKVEEHAGEMDDIAAMRTTISELEGSVSNLRQNPTSPQVSLVNPKDIKVREFEGNEKDFRDFIDDSKMFFEIVRPQLAELIEWLQGQPDLVDVSDAEKAFPGAAQLGRQLHG